MKVKNLAHRKAFHGIEEDGSKKTVQTSDKLLSQIGQDVNKTQRQVTITNVSSQKPSISIAPALQSQQREISEMDLSDICVEQVCKVRRPSVVSGAETSPEVKVSIDSGVNEITKALGFASPFQQLGTEDFDGDWVNCLYEDHSIEKYKPRQTGIKLEGQSCVLTISGNSNHSLSEDPCRWQPISETKRSESDSSVTQVCKVRRPSVVSGAETSPEVKVSIDSGVNEITKALGFASPFQQLGTEDFDGDWENCLYEEHSTVNFKPRQTGKSDKQSSVLTISAKYDNSLSEDPCTLLQKSRQCGDNGVNRVSQKIQADFVGSNNSRVEQMANFDFKCSQRNIPIAYEKGLNDAGQGSASYGQAGGADGVSGDVVGVGDAPSRADNSDDSDDWFNEVLQDVDIFLK